MQVLEHAQKGQEVLIDDTNNSLGQKFANADLIGIPKQIIIGPKSIANGKYEIKDRSSGDRYEELIN